MRLRARDEGEPRELIPARPYFAVLVGVYDLGTRSGPYGPRHQVLIEFELHVRDGPARDGKGKVCTIAQFYNLSFSQLSNLRRDVEAILGRTFSDEEALQGYDLAGLLGLTCRLDVVCRDRGEGTIRNSIDALAPRAANDPVPKSIRSHVYFEIDVHDLTIPDSVHDWIARIIRQSEEFAGRPTPTPASNPRAIGRSEPIPGRWDLLDDEDGIAVPTATPSDPGVEPPTDRPRKSEAPKPPATHDVESSQRRSRRPPSRDRARDLDDEDEG